MYDYYWTVTTAGAPAFITVSEMGKQAQIATPVYSWSGTKTQDCPSPSLIFLPHHRGKQFKDILKKSCLNTFVFILGASPG